MIMEIRGSRKWGWWWLGGDAGRLLGCWKCPVAGPCGAYTGVFTSQKFIKLYVGALYCVYFLLKSSQKHARDLHAGGPMHPIRIFRNKAQQKGSSILSISEHLFNQNLPVPGLGFLLKRVSLSLSQLGTNEVPGPINKGLLPFSKVS